jgi:LEA14-like dessication related protein
LPTVPEVELLGVDWQNLSLSDASAVLRLRVKNLNDFEMNLRQLDYGLSLGGTRVADAGVKERKRFKRGQAQVLEIPVSIRPSDLGMAAFGMLQGSDATYDIGGMMSFTTPYGPLELPFDRSGRTPFSR